MPINLLLALYLVYSRYLFYMGPTYMFSRGVDINEVWRATVVEKGPRKCGDLFLQTCCRTKVLLVEYLLMQNWYLTGEDRNPKTREKMREVKESIPLLTDLCLAMRSDPLGMIRGLGE